MMYIDAVCKGIDDIPNIPDDIRTMIKQRYVDEGLESLCAELKLRDPEYYRQVDLKNPKRVIHGLLFIYTPATLISLSVRDFRITCICAGILSRSISTWLIIPTFLPVRCRFSSTFITVSR